MQVLLICIQFDKINPFCINCVRHRTNKTESKQMGLICVFTLSVVTTWFFTARANVPLQNTRCSIQNQNFYKKSNQYNNNVLADNGTDADLWRDGMAIIRNGLYNNYVIILHSLYERSLSMKFLHKIGLIMFCIVLIPLNTNIIIFQKF